jgi:glutamate-ammonia-ligase adenylyltransferase
VRPSDLFVSSDLTEEQAQAYLHSLGFRDAAAADRHLQEMADDLPVREALGRVAQPLIEAICAAPDPDAALVGLSRYVGARASKAMFVSYLLDDPAALGVLVELLGTSPFLTEILIRDPEYFHWLMSQLNRPPNAALEDEWGDSTRSKRVRGRGMESAEALDALKRRKRQHLLLIAARDILGRDTLQASTAQLSMLADLMVDNALEVVAGDLLAADGLDRMPGRFAVIGMGKLGGQELNYSSDIDVIYLYEPDDEDDSGSHAWFQRLARKLTAALTEHTAESYFYRVDLRLRPMGRSGNVAHSFNQLKHYYGTWGVTFERFAMIKARPSAGDRDLGLRFVESMQKFVYRPYLDHAALEEIYQHKAVTDRAVQSSSSSRNVKLGRGGIREAELFTQVLQLTYGARHLQLRQRNTLKGLEALQKTGFITHDVFDSLTRAYVFLRTVEHRLQMVQESQIHTLSASRDELAICARRLRFENIEQMEAELDAHRRRVHDVYKDLFERRKGTTSFEARQFYRILGDEVSEEDARAHLAECGFRDPAAALAAVRALGQHAATASAPATARNVLANFLAASTKRIVRCAKPELLLMRFEQLATEWGGATRLALSLLENHVLCDVLVDVLDHGELLAQRLIQHPELLDALVQPIPSLDALRRSFEASLARFERFDRQNRMDAVRRFKRNEEFKILVGWLATGALDQLHERLSLLADYCIAQAARWHAPATLDDPLRSWAVVALGKLGGAELTVHSDLDLVFVYEDTVDASDSDARWQTFVERTQSFLGEPTGEGVAYHIDTRLRPEGTKGALAIPFPSFCRYLEERAEPWERLAWTRAQVLVGSPDLAQRLRSTIEAFVYGPWDARLPEVMHHIRMRMEHELGKEGTSRLDLKVGKGGLADIDFMLQLAQIREGSANAAFRIPGTRRLLKVLPSTSYIRPEEAERLSEAYRILRTIETLVRLDADASISWISPDPVTMNAIGTRMGFGDAPGGRLVAQYREVTERVRTIYTAVMSRL